MLFVLLLINIRAALVAVEGSEIEWKSRSSDGPIDLQNAFVAAMKHVDYERMKALASQHKEGIFNISDVVGSVAMEYHMNEQAQMEQNIKDMLKLEKSKFLDFLETLYLWVDQVDNGVNFHLYGGTVTLFDYFVSAPDDPSEEHIAIAKVLVAALQNNDQAQTPFLRDRPDCFESLGKRLRQNPEGHWFASVAGVLVRRIPQIKITRFTKDSQIAFQKLVEALVGQGAMQKRGQRLLEDLIMFGGNLLLEEKEINSQTF